MDWSHLDPCTADSAEAHKMASAGKTLLHLTLSMLFTCSWTLITVGSSTNPQCSVRRWGQCRRLIGESPQRLVRQHSGLERYRRSPAAPAHQIFAVAVAGSAVHLADVLNLLTDGRNNV